MDIQIERERERERDLEVLDLCSKMKPKSLIHLDGHGFGGGVRPSFLR